MRWLALVVGLIAAFSLAACSPEAGTPGTTTLAPAPSMEKDPSSPMPASVTAQPQPAVTLAPTGTFSPVPTSTPLPAHTPTLLPTDTRMPTATPTLSSTPAPTLPPLLTPADGQPLAFSLGWQFNANGHLTAGALLETSEQESYFLTSLGRTLYAVARGGQLTWSARAPGPVYALAVLEGDRIATGDDAGVVVLFGARGQRLWQQALMSRVTSLKAWRGGLLAGGWDEHLTFLNTGADEDRIRWSTDLGGQVSAIATLPGLALAATLDGSIGAVDAMGAVVWHLDAGAPVVHLGVAENGQAPVILAGLQDGRLVALDTGGNLLWQRTLGEGTEGSPVWYTADLDQKSPVEILAGTGGSEPVLALLGIEGEVVWRLSVPSPVQAVTATDLDGDGTSEIVAGLASGEILAYDRQGRRRGSVHAGLPVWGLEISEGAPAGPTGASSVLVRSDVVAWRLEGSGGNAGGPWLPPPKLIELGQSPLTPNMERREGEAILLFVGDVAPGRSMEMQLDRYGPNYPWSGLQPLLEDADLAVANLECALTSGGQPLQKPYLIRAHPRWGEMLVSGGFQLVTVANNHALDFGQVGLDETLDTLGALNIGAVGAGRTADEAERPALLTVRGVRVAVLAYAAPRWDGSEDVPATDRLAWAVPARIKADVRAVRDGADLVVVLLHAGTEYAANPSPDQVAAAHAAIDAGADLVVGHHPHVTQTVERYRQGLIVYSLGDAVFDIPRSSAMLGQLLRVHVTPEGLVSAELWPFWIEDAIRPRLLAGDQGAPRVRVVFP